MRSNGRLCLAGALMLGLVAAGCSKKQETVASSSTTTETSPQAAAPAAPTPPPSAPMRPAPPAQARAVSEANFQVQDLQLQVDAYQKIYKRKPESLAQMVQEGFLHALPPAPPGRQYTLDPATQRVSLVP